MRYLLRVEGVLNSVTTWVGRIGAWISVPLMIIIVFDVITRRFLVLGSTKLQEGEWHMHAVLFLLCLGFAYLRNAHVRISLVHERFSPRVQRWIELVGCLIFAIPYCAIVFYFATDFVERSWAVGEASDSATGLPFRWAIKAFLPAGMLLLLLAAVAVLLRKFVELFGPPELRRAAEEGGNGGAGAGETERRD